MESDELQNIRDLLADFSSGNALSPEEILRITYLRYHHLGQLIYSSSFLKALRLLETQLPEVLFELTRVFHEVIFSGIFWNSGEFRKSTDPGNGEVYFGPPDRKSGRTVRFRGSPPDKIESHLHEIYQWFSPQDRDPILTAARFYQRFVYIHPFYDANGRVGRLIASLYLAFHELAILWKPLEENKKNKLVSLLNTCHKQMGKPHYDNKVAQLKRFLAQYIISLKELDPDLC